MLINCMMKLKIVKANYPRPMEITFPLNRRLVLKVFRGEE